MAREPHSSVAVRTSAINGSGLFATRNFRRGEIVYTYPKGRIVRRDAIPTLSADEKAHLDRLGNDAYEIIEPPGCFLNHSCEPNIIERGRTGFARRDIRSGEELTIDYDEHAFLEKPFTCRCGGRSCRGIVRGKASRA